MLSRGVKVQENGTSSTVAPGHNPIDLNDSDKTNERLEDESPGGSKGKSNELTKTLDSS